MLSGGFTVALGDWGDNNIIIINAIDGTSIDIRDVI